MAPKGVIIKNIRGQKLRGKMKEWSVDFPTTLRLLKPEKENCVKLEEHEGSSQQDPVYQNSKDGITSKTNPAHNPAATFKAKESRIKRMDGYHRLVIPQKFHKCFGFRFIVSFWLPLRLLRIVL